MEMKKGTYSVLVSLGYLTELGGSKNKHLSCILEAGGPSKIMVPAWSGLG